MEQKLGIELYIEAAEQHGQDSAPDHEVGDLQDLARKMWEIMSPGQRLKLMADEDIREAIENNLSDIDYAKVFYQLAETQGLRLRIDEARRFDVFSELVSAFPGFLIGDDVNGGDLVDWVSAKLGSIGHSVTP